MILSSVQLRRLYSWVRESATLDVLLKVHIQNFPCYFLLHTEAHRPNSQPRSVNSLIPNFEQNDSRGFHTNLKNVYEAVP